MRTYIQGIALAACAALAFGAGGCAKSTSSIATVNIVTIEANWPKFQNYANQLQASFAAIEASKSTPSEKQQALAQLRVQSKRWQDEVTNEMRGAVATIAQSRHYQLVVTREGVAYGGDDITVDVEKSMSIPTASPSPGI